MSNEREKLIGILRVPIFPHLDADPAEVVADYLIDNGVTLQEWIPVSERLPTTDGRFMVTIKGRSGKPHVEMRNFHAGAQKWENQSGWGFEENILAWKARPKPYKRSAKEDNHDTQ